MDSQEQMTSEDTVTLALCCSSVTEQMGVCSLCAPADQRGARSGRPGLVPRAAGYSVSDTVSTCAPSYRDLLTRQRHKAEQAFMMVAARPEEGWGPVGSQCTPRHIPVPLPCPCLSPLHPPQHPHMHRHGAWSSCVPARLSWAYEHPERRDVRSAWQCWRPAAVPGSARWHSAPY